MKKLLTILMLAFTPLVMGLEATISGTNVNITYTEPTTNTDGTALTDLSHVSIYYDLGDGPVLAVDVPATAQTGGGTVTETITVPVLEGQESDVQFWTYAVDESGNQSPQSEIVTKRIDRLAPSAPQ